VAISNSTPPAQGNRSTRSSRDPSPAMYRRQDRLAFVSIAVAAAPSACATRPVLWLHPDCTVLHDFDGPSPSAANRNRWPSSPANENPIMSVSSLITLVGHGRAVEEFDHIRRRSSMKPITSNFKPSGSENAIVASLNRTKKSNNRARSADRVPMHTHTRKHVSRLMLPAG
jgi:hypothetical protein